MAPEGGPKKRRGGANKGIWKDRRDHVRLKAVPKLAWSGTLNLSQKPFKVNKKRSVRRTRRHAKTSESTNEERDKRIHRSARSCAITGEKQGGGEGRSWSIVKSELGIQKWGTKRQPRAGK